MLQRLRILASLAGLMFLASAGNAVALDYTLDVTNVAPLPFGKIVLASGSTAQITLATSGNVTVTSGTAVLLPSPKTIALSTVTVSCTRTTGNGCKNTTYTITVAATPSTAGRTVTINSLTITPPTGGGGNVTINAPSLSGSPVTFTVVAGNVNSWSTTFKVGMTYTISGPSSPTTTLWNYSVRVQ